MPPLIPTSTRNTHLPDGAHHLPGDVERCEADGEARGVEEARDGDVALEGRVHPRGGPVGEVEGSVRKVPGVHDEEAAAAEGEGDGSAVVLLGVGGGPLGHCGECAGATAGAWCQRRDVTSPHHFAQYRLPPQVRRNQSQ